VAEGPGFMTASAQDLLKKLFLPSREWVPGFFIGGECEDA